MSGVTGGDVAVVGAGLIGLAVAFELAERGAEVRVFDRAEPAHAASWAGAGMLAPYTENADDEEMIALCAASLGQYPAFVERVRAAGGADPHLRLDGIVHAAYGEAAHERLGERAHALRARGVDCELLDRERTLRTEPWLGAQTSGGLLVRGEGRVDNRRLGRALIAACRERGVVVARVERLTVECDERRVLGIRTDRGFVAATITINACGAWAAHLPGLRAPNVPPVEPVKGQMLALETPAGFVRHATWLSGAYVVPRDDGRLLVGATVEPGVADARVTAGGMAALLQAVLASAPSLGGFSVSETWAGLRPGTPDGRPFIGPMPLDGLYVAGGHFRNGILLAPVTAQLLARCIAGETVAELAAFSPGRAVSSAA